MTSRLEKIFARRSLYEFQKLDSSSYNDDEPRLIHSENQSDLLMYDRFFPTLGEWEQDFILREYISAARDFQCRSIYNIVPFLFIRRLSVQGAKLSSSAQEECCRFGECLLPVWLVVLGATKGSQRQTVDDLRQAIRCFHKRQHAHVYKRAWSGHRVHLKITTSAGSEKSDRSVVHLTATLRATWARKTFVRPHQYCTKHDYCPSKTRRFFIGYLFQRYSLRMKLRHLHLVRGVSALYMSISPRNWAREIFIRSTTWFLLDISVLHSRLCQQEDFEIRSLQRRGIDASFSLSPLTSRTKVLWRLVGSWKA